MYQSTTLVGNLGSDPEMRYTPAGVPVANFRMAVNRTWTDTNGQRQDKTTWFRVTAWRKLAELCQEYLKKGAKVLVVGELEDPKPYTDREGNMRANLEVTASVVRFLNSRGESTAPMNPDEVEARIMADDDIPF